MLPFILLLLISACSAAVPRPAFPLSVKGKLIVDSDGTPFQMRCANWPGHMETMLPEGIQWTSIDDIVTLIVESNVFNCIRLTYSADMLSIVSPSMTARQSLAALNMTQTIADVTKHNPSLIDSTLLDVQTAVVKACDKQNIAVLFDNQVSKPMWCCSYTDGNGWWNDEYFNVLDWFTSLNQIATHYADPATGTPNAVAFSLRNELRNNKMSRDDQVADWYKYVPVGIKAINTGNPNALIFISGLSYDCDFSYLNEDHPANDWDTLYRQLNSTLVFEAHIYSWSGYGKYTNTCTEVISAFDKAIGYGYQHDRPLVLTELGLNVDKFPSIDTDAAYWHCITQYVQQQKLGFGIWLLAGSYLYRTSGINSPDTFGALETDFTAYKNDKWALALQAMIVKLKNNVASSEWE